MASAPHPSADSFSGASALRAEEEGRERHEPKAAEDAPVPSARPSRRIG